MALVPREDRDPAARVFATTQSQLRTAIARAFKAAGVPAFSPRDLRLRRISLWHRQGVSWATIGHWVGQKSRMTTADTYTHVLMDGRDLAWDELLRHRSGDARNGRGRSPGATPVLHREPETAR
jgi:integrase